MKSHIKKAGVLICAAVTIIAAAYRADAGVAVWRMDAHYEKAILALCLEQLNYQKSVITNLEKLSAIRSLKTVYSYVEAYNKLKKESENINVELKNLAKTETGKLGIDGKGIKVADLTDIIGSGTYNGKTVKLDGTDSGSEITLGESIAAAGIDGSAGAEVNERTYKALLYAYGLIDENGNPTEKARSSGSSSASSSSSSSSSSDGENLENALYASMEELIETVPMSFPGAQRSATDIIGSVDSTIAEKQIYAGNIADSSRDRAMKSIAAAMAPYMIKEGKGSYRELVNKIEEQSQASLEKVKELADGGPSQALRTIAALCAVQVEQSALQNQLLTTMIDMLADEIKMMGINAALNVESYTQGMSENMQRYISVQQSIGIAD